MELEMISIIMIACNDAGRSYDKPVDVSEGQDIGGLGFLAPLIGHRLAAFLGNSMAPIEIEFR